MRNKALNKSLDSWLLSSGFDCIAGVDEAGRGPLAGPVVASAVLLKESSFRNRIDDSKKLSSAQRDKAFKEIIDKAYVGLGIVSEAAIDEVNILNATCVAMERAISDLMKHRFKNICFIVDGRLKLDIDNPYRCFIKAESRSISVACASIVAKVVRDRIMSIYNSISPNYGFSRHKGYGTELHFEKIKEFGPSIFHRKTFYPVSEYFHNGTRKK